MDVSSATSSPVSSAIEPAPAQQSAQLSSPESRYPSGSNVTADTSVQSAPPAPDPNARVGGTVDTYA
ncbi:hypothetical protein [Alteromonas sp. CYL-A6]|uniref:hypothetical protein n=1 Tax=Alteromonas nitratireducens TaxID=3390813 RepID=UPI0034B73503